MKEFVEFIVKQLVNNPEKVSVEETTTDENTIGLKLKVDQSDIGKKGQNINAI